MSLSDHPWRSRFIYGVGGDEVDWQTTLPTQEWKRRTPTVGGARTAASGTPAGYTVRRDYNLALPIRFYESEHEDLNALITWGQSKEEFLWYPDANVPGESYLVYLESPNPGEDWEPVRDTDFPRAFVFEIVLRRVADEPWLLNYYPSC